MDYISDGSRMPADAYIGDDENLLLKNEKPG
jgi:hypothetical protein